MNKFKLRFIELLVLLLISLVTVILQPPIPLLAIPFLIIISMRSLFIKLEDSEHEQGEKE